MDKKGLLLVSLAAMIWGAAGIFVRALSGFGITSMEIVFGRALLTVVLLALILLICGRSAFKIKLKDIWLFASSGILSIVMFNYCYYKTMALSSLSVAAVLLYTAPFFVVIISALFFKERLTLKKCIACVVAFVGCCMVSGLFSSSQRISGECLIYGLLTGFGYSLYTVFGNILLKRGYSSLTITFYSFVFALVGASVLSDFKGTALQMVAKPQVLLVFAAMAVTNTIIPYILYTSGLKRIEASIAPIIATIEPVSATVIGIILFNEIPDIWGFIGIAVVLLAVVILNHNSQRYVKVKAYAKLNLTLDIRGKREDGYHLLDSVMVSVEPHDIIVLSKNDAISVECSDDGLSGEQNIAYKAAKAFFDATSIKGGAKIHIEKHIPQAAGLGGGSADAAAVIRGLDRLYEASLSMDAMRAIGLSVGADVPFCIEGGTARVGGIGEKTEPLPQITGLKLIIIKKGKKSSTADMYARLDAATDRPECTTDAAVRAIKAGDNSLLIKNISNHFASVSQQTDIGFDALKKASDAFSLSGSGPSVFAVFADGDKANSCFEELKASERECFISDIKGQGIVFE